MTDTEDALRVTIESCHNMSFITVVESLEDILRFYASGARLLASDGRLYAGARREPETDHEGGNDDIGAYWAPLVWRGPTNWKGITRMVTVEVEDDVARAICAYHYRYGISDLVPEEQHDKNEQGHYLAMWTHADGEWRIVAQAFSSHDPSFISRLRELKE